jgi:hypothetical protein
MLTQTKGFNKHWEEEMEVTLILLGILWITSMIYHNVLNRTIEKKLRRGILIDWLIDLKSVSPFWFSLRKFPSFIPPALWCIIQPIRSIASFLPAPPSEWIGLCLLYSVILCQTRIKWESAPWCKGGYRFLFWFCKKIKEGFFRQIAITRIDGENFWWT